MHLGKFAQFDFGQVPFERVVASLEAERASTSGRMQQGAKPENFASLQRYVLALERAREVMLAFAGAKPASATESSPISVLSGLAGSSSPAEAPGDPPKEILSVLVKAGYLALTHGLVGPAREIFDGLAAIRPSSPIPLIGQALILVESGKGVHGAALLREKAIGLDPDCDDLVRAHLGLVLRLIGSNQEAWNELQQVVAAGRDPDAVSFARGLLQEDSPGTVPSFATSLPASAREPKEGFSGG